MPEQLGKYTLLKKIAVGGMAEIHLSEQSGPGGFKKQLVIKRILPHLVGDEKFLQMFQDEARVAAMMNHPNIVQIFDLGEEDNNFFIAMEYVSGLNLRSVIQNSNDHGMWLSPEYIAKIGSQICEGLEYAHNFCDSSGHHLNLIHRDVSPQNIILSKQGIIKIVDFGIAKAKSNVQETQAGIIKGKLAYMSPEQVKGQSLDRRSDLFSLGIVMYELATHQRPFHGKSDIDMLRAILEAGPKPIETLRQDFPPELTRIIFRALAKNRDERYQSARELQWDLENFLQSWGRPIGAFQLAELINRLEQLNGQGAPAQPPPQQAPPTPPPAPAPKARGPAAPEEFGNEETMWADDPRATNQSAPTPQINFGSQPATYPPQNTGGWGGQQSSQWGNSTPPSENNDWDDDGDETVLSFPPGNSPNYQMSPPQRNFGERDLDTLSEPGLETTPPSAMTLIDDAIPPEIAASYLGGNQRPHPDIPSMPRMPNIPNMPNRHGISAAPTIINDHAPMARPVPMQITPSATPPPWNPPSSQTTPIPSMPMARRPKKKSNIGLIIALSLLMVGAGVAVAYFFFLK